ncbi:MAG: SRPBCC family protein [Dehalococcoidia bacterium]
MASTADTLTVAAEPGGLTIRITREFDAPPALVYRVMTDPETWPRWWGPRRYQTVVDRMDVRVGGGWQARNIDDAGNEFVFHGEYREIVPGERVVQTFEFEGAPGEVSVETMTLEDLGGRTRMTVVSEFSSTEARDGMIAGGMEDGMRETYERLDEELANAAD